MRDDQPAPAADAGETGPTGPAEDDPPSSATDPPSHPSSDAHAILEVAAASSLRAADRALVGPLAALLERLADAFDRPLARVAVRLVDDGEMCRLHADHLGDPSTTDVITFPASDPGAPIDVDLAVCVDEARRQAAERDHAPEEELLLYVLHGLLHCAGHDDHDPAAFDAMHAEEDRVLARLGVGARFHSPNASESRP